METTESDDRILVIDDNHENVAAVSELLAFSGYTSVRSVVDSSRAVDVILEWDPDVVLLDLHMPGMSGYDVMESLKASQPPDAFVPILVFTADWTVAAMKRAYDCGANDFITKPFDAMELLVRVRNFIGMRRMHKQLRERNTKLAEAIEALQRSQAEVTAANRELEGFTHSVSHDLRGPLRAIMSTSQMLMEDCFDVLPEDNKEMLQRQSENAKKLNAIIEELLKLSKVSRAQMAVKDLDLTEIAEEVANDIETSGSHFRIARQMRGRGDSLLVRLVFLNLMGNAAKFSPDGGELEVGQTGEGGAAVFYVRDHGVGFELAHADRLFLPFERLVTDAQFPGTGIGLANVKRIIDKHGGRIWAESAPGHGSTFFFTLAPPA